MGLRLDCVQTNHVRILTPGERLLLDYKSKKWWAALRRRNDRNQHHYVGVWLKNNKSYCFDLVIQGSRIRKGGFRTAERAALARDFLIDQMELPHKRAFDEPYFDYLVKKHNLMCDRE